MRQLPAIDSRSWKQNRGTSAPAASQACSSVYSAGTSISLPSMMILLIAVLSIDWALGLAAFLGHPLLDMRQMRPTKGMIAVAVRPKMLEPRFCLLQRGDMPAGNRPHDEMGPRW